MISPHAIIEEGAVIGKDVSIGHFSIIGKDVKIGDGTKVGPMSLLPAIPASVKITRSFNMHLLEKYRKVPVTGMNQLSYALAIIMLFASAAHCIQGPWKAVE